MKREEVIAAIEKFSAHPECDHWRKEFFRVASQALAQNHARRASLSTDFQRAIIYLFILMTGLRYLRKADRRFLRFNLRSVLMASGLFVALLVEIIGATVLVARFGLGIYTGVGFMYLLLMEFAGLIWVLKRIERRTNDDELGMVRNCVKCRYDLSGHESVLGDDIWVGPAVCPECGQAYPAVGK